MKTVKEILQNHVDQVFDSPYSDANEIDEEVFDAMKEYARQACKEQREICAGKANDLFAENASTNGRLITPVLVKSEMINCNEPE